MSFSYHKVLKGYIIEVFNDNMTECVQVYGRNQFECIDNAVKVKKLFIFKEKYDTIKY